MKPEENPLTFEEAYRRFRDPIRSQAERILGDYHEAEDLAQDALLRVYLRWPSLRHATAAPAWIQAIGRHAAIDRLRRHSPCPRTTDALDRLESTPRGRIEALLPQLVEALERLPNHLGITVLLHSVDRLPLHEISRLTRTSPGNVRVRLHRARAILKPIAAAHR